MQPRPSTLHCLCILWRAVRDLTRHFFARPSSSYRTVACTFIVASDRGGCPSEAGTGTTPAVGLAQILPSDHSGNMAANRADSSHFELGNETTFHTQTGVIEPHRREVLSGVAVGLSSRHHESPNQDHAALAQHSSRHRHRLRETHPSPYA